MPVLLSIIKTIADKKATFQRESGIIDGNL